MSVFGLRYKGVEPLFPEEWNTVVDALDILYLYNADLKTRLDCLEPKVDEIYNMVSPPKDLETYELVVGSTPIPLSDVDKIVKRIHVRVPSWASTIVYIGNSQKQNFVLEPSQGEVLHIDNPKKVYVKSLGNVTIYVMLEV